MVAAAKRRIEIAHQINAQSADLQKLIVLFNEFLGIDHLKLNQIAQSKLSGASDIVKLSQNN